jgi:uncharacterized protein YjbI with pentapeptide repeats
MGSDETHTARFKDVSLNRAKINGTLDLVGATVGGKLNLDELQVGQDLLMYSDMTHTAHFNDLGLYGVRIDGQFALTGATVDGKMNLGELHVGQSLLMYSDETHKAHFNDVDLNGAKIGGTLYLTGATVEGKLNLDALQVGQDLLMPCDETHAALFRDVVLRGAKIDGTLDLSCPTVAGTLDMNELQVGQDVLMRSTKYGIAQFKDVNLNGAKIGRQFDLRGAAVDGTLSLVELQVGESVAMGSDALNNARFRDVAMNGAKILWQLDLRGAQVDGALKANRLQVGQDLIMRSDPEVAPNGRFAVFTGSTDLTFVRVGGNLDLQGAAFADLDLSGGFITGELLLGSVAARPTIWQDAAGQPGYLTLRDTQIGTLADAQDSWPDPGKLDLAGFLFAHLGGADGPQTETEMRNRGMPWWDRWVRRDPNYTPTPYIQISTALVAAGDRDASNEIRFLGRERERETRWNEGNYAGWLLLTGLSNIAGYGIGTYTFAVLTWVFDLTLFGTVILWFTVPAERRDNHGRWWCFGASLSRVLPVIEINKEFTEFFNDPKRGRLYPWQIFVFSVLGMFGWVLGGVLIAALTGITQAS